MIRSLPRPTNPVKHTPSSHPGGATLTVWPVLAFLVAVAFAARLVGLTYGLSIIFHPDEPTSIAEATALLHGTHDALTFANPPLYKYILAALFLPLGLAGNSDQTTRIVIARAASALFGAMTILPIYAIGTLLRTRATGLVAAVLASATLLLVRESHFAVNDSLATLCSTLALLATLRVALYGRRRDYVLAGAGLGLACAAKYQCAAVLVPLLIAHVYNRRRASQPPAPSPTSDGAVPARHLAATAPPAARYAPTLADAARPTTGPTLRARLLPRPGAPTLDNDLLFAPATAALTAIIAFPPLVTETRRVIADVYVFLMLPSRLGFEGMDPSGASPFYVKSLGWDVGWPILLLALAAAVFAIRRRDWPVLAVASLPIVLYLLMGSSKMYVARFMLPGVPALIALGAVAIHDLAAFARRLLVHPIDSSESTLLVTRRPRSTRLVVLLTTALAATALLGTLPETVRFDALLTRPDTRTQALDWLATNLPADATVLVDPPPFGPRLDNLPVHVVRPPQSHTMYDTTLDDYRAQGIQYVVSSSFVSDAPALDPTRNARRLQFYAALAASAQHVAEFSPELPGPDPAFVYDRIYGPLDSLDQLQYPGPKLEIYRL